MADTLRVRLRPGEDEELRGLAQKAGFASVSAYVRSMIGLTAEPEPARGSPPKASANVATGKARTRFPVVCGSRVPKGAYCRLCGRVH